MENGMNGKVVSAQGYTYGQLQRAFGNLTDGMADWKMPIYKTIHVHDYDMMNEACKFIAACELKAVGSPKNSMVDVKAVGYYVATGEADAVDQSLWADPTTPGYIIRSQ